MVIEPWGNNCIRVRSTRNSKVSDENGQFLTPPKTMQPSKAMNQGQHLKTAASASASGAAVALLFIKMIRESSVRNTKEIIRHATSILKATTTALK